MNDLTDLVLANNRSYTVEEWVKQGGAFNFDSGLEQRVLGASIPAIQLTIDYAPIQWEDFEQLRASYQTNHSNTFIVNLDDTTIDKRSQFMGINASVWTFKEFEFETVGGASDLFVGKITLLTSVFFNFTAYQNLFTQTSSYTPSTSTDQSFIDLLDDVPPYNAKLKFNNNALFSQIGESIRHIKNKGGLKRYWTLSWLLKESEFLQLITFYRKKSGMMGTFGFPAYGYNLNKTPAYVVSDYIVDQDDYILFYEGIDGTNLARFVKDSFSYQKRLDGFFQVECDFIEVKQ